ncbi:competence/damage-inducible protein A [Thermogladius sp.]|uniref:competence/damage-inducible protein A n=1 Tax=Thermogladius sp. TaxID=2023064 RepID=UPI003D13F11F
MKARASIMVIGSEILKGVTLDTNSNWLARKLTNLGFEVVRILVVPDSIEDISWGLRALLGLSSLVVTTGGLGFTEDDITAEAIASSLGLKLDKNEEAFNMIKARHGDEAYKYVKAAFIPEKARPLPNEVGVSPGFLLEFQGRLVIALPGVPAEMREMFERYVEPLLQKVTGRVSVEASIVTGHMVEAEVDGYIRDLRRLSDVYIKTHAERPVKVTIVAYGNSAEDACNRLNEVLGEISKRLRVVHVEKTETCK